MGVCCNALASANHAGRRSLVLLQSMNLQSMNPRSPPGRRRARASGHDGSPQTLQAAEINASGHQPT
jgi:hypothetical protein